MQRFSQLISSQTNSASISIGTQTAAGFIYNLNSKQKCADGVLNKTKLSSHDFNNKSPLIGTRIVSIRYMQLVSIAVSNFFSRHLLRGGDRHRKSWTWIIKTQHRNPAYIFIISLAGNHVIKSRQKKLTRNRGFGPKFDFFCTDWRQTETNHPRPKCQQPQNIINILAKNFF